MKTIILILLIIGFISIKGHPQSISENTSYPTLTQVQCSYKFNGAGGIFFNYWMLPSNCIAVNNNTSGVYLYLKWKNIEESAGKSTLSARYHTSQYYTNDVYATVGPFQLRFPNPTFVGGSTKNIPCYSTNPVTISLNPYKNTADNNIDKDTEITNHFRWTLPTGWRSSGGKTGTFNANSSLVVIPPASSWTETIQAQPYADAGQELQYGPTISLQITRNLENFSISGPTSVFYNSTYRYEVPSVNGVSYSWQLPVGWTGQSTGPYIDVTAGCSTGIISCTMTGCNQSKPSTFTISSNTLNPVTLISGPSPVCSSGATFSINNLPPVNSIEWTCGPGLSISSGQNTNSCTFSVTVTGSSWVRATLVTACGSVTLPQKDVWVGSPSTPTDIFGFSGNGMEFGQNSIYEFEIYSPPIEGVTNYQWLVGGGTILSGQGTNLITIRTSSNTNGLTKYFDVRVRVENSCGRSSYFCRSGFIGTGIAPMIVITPNPTSGEASIELASSNMEAFAKEVEWELEVYDSMQNLKEKKTKIKTTQTKINTTNWKDGIYIVRAKIGNDVISGKLIVKH